MENEKPPVDGVHAYNPNAFYEGSSSNRKPLGGGRTFDEEMWAHREMLPPTTTEQEPTDEEKKRTFFQDLGDGS